MTIKYTPLYQLHLQLGAKITEFAGYQMPLQYQEGIIKEHLHCRSQVGFFDISHMGQFWLTGKHIDQELEKFIPSAISSLKTGQQQYSVLLNENAGVIDDIMLTRFEEGFLLVVNAACKEKDFAYLKTQLSSNSQITALSEQALLALQGVDAVNVLQKFSVEIANLKFMHGCKTQLDGIECFVNRCGYTGEDGFEISVANQYAMDIAELLLKDDRVKPIGLGARDTLRLEAGLCLYGHELDETINPLAAGLSWTLRKNLQTLICSDRLANYKKQGTGQKRVGLLIEGKQPVRAGAILLNQNHEEIGIVTSGGFSPTLKQAIAMAYVNVEEISQNAQFYAQVRNKQIPACLTKLPFVAHRYYPSR